MVRFRWLIQLANVPTFIYTQAAYLSIALTPRLRQSSGTNLFQTFGRVSEEVPSGENCHSPDAAHVAEKDREASTRMDPPRVR